MNPFETTNPFETSTTGAAMINDEPKTAGNPFTDSVPTGLDNPFNSEAAAPTQQPAFSGFNNQQNNSGGLGYNSNFGNNSNNGKRKYKFVQLYLLINPKFMASGGQNTNGESPVMEISHNIDYGNVRLSFCNIKNDTFEGNNSIKVPSLERVTTINLYPETAEQLLYNIENWKATQFKVYERVIQTSSSWGPNETHFKVDPTEKTVAVISKNRNSTVIYVFTEWQVNALVNTLKFLTNGSAWNLEQVKFLAPDA